LTLIGLTFLSAFIFISVTPYHTSASGIIIGGEREMNLKYLAYLKFTVEKEIIFRHTPHGIRHDIHYEGELTGDLLSGQMSGIDYMNLRPDGIDEINTRATIETPDGAYVSVHITGYVEPDGTIRDSYVRFLSGYEKYKWLNDTVCFGHGGPIAAGTFEVYYYYYSTGSEPESN